MTGMLLEAFVNYSVNNSNVFYSCLIWRVQLLLLLLLKIWRNLNFFVKMLNQIENLKTLIKRKNLRDSEFKYNQIRSIKVY